jgi:MFS superfamily sulfate permease-like transporter
MGYLRADDRQGGWVSVPSPSAGSTLRADIPAGLVLFLITLPLCLGIALASDAPLISGVVASVVGGVLVGLLSGSHTAVSGPAAGLAVVVATSVGELGGFSALLAALLVAGTLQVGFGLARLGFLALLVPSSVIKGMLAAIGIIVVLKQIPHALGHDVDFEGEESFWIGAGQENTLTELVGAFSTWHPGVVLVTLAGLLILRLWEHPRLAESTWARVLPGPLVVAAAGVGINELYRLYLPSFLIRAADGRLVQLPLVQTQSLFAALPHPDLFALARPEVWMIGVEIAAIASLESLLSVEATDRLDPRRRTTPPDRELVAQGVGNIVSGLLGGLPLTAVIVRSSANIYAGARSRRSTIAHGLFLAVFVATLPSTLNLIPLGALAAILLQVGYRLARWELFEDMWRRGPTQFAPFIVTVVVTVFSDLLMGVGAGLAVGVIATLVADYHSAVVRVSDGDAIYIRLTRDVSFLQKYALVRAFQEVLNDENARIVVLDGVRVGFVDPDIQDLIERFVDAARHRDLQVDLRGFDRKLIHNAAVAR